MLTLYEPCVDDLWFRQQLLGDEQTMSYNHAYGGTIPFPQERWSDWHNKWIKNHDGRRFYRYLKEADRFVGEVSYHFEEEKRIYLADVIIYAPCRRKGYGRGGLLLLCEAAKENGVSELCDTIAIDNPSVKLFRKCGFAEVLQTNEYVLVRKAL